MSAPANQPSDIIRRKKLFTFIRTDGDTSLFLDNFELGPELNAGRFASFYELSLRVSHDHPPGRFLLDVYENDPECVNTTVNRVTQIHSERITARESEVTPEPNTTVNQVTQVHSEPSRDRESEDTPESGSESETEFSKPSTVNIIEFGGITKAMMVILSDSRMFFSSLMPGINAQLQKEYSLGIVLAAEVEEAGSENSVLLAHFPCLGFSQASEPNAASQNNLPEPEDNTESWSLSRYLTLKELAIDPNDIVEQRLCVHRAMFACFNEDFIMIAQSKGARNLTRNIFPEQDRAGAFHLLVNMIAETLRYDDRKILKVLGANAAVYDIGNSIDDETSSHVVAVRNDLVLLKAVKIVIDHQIEILRDLQDMFQRAGPDHITPSIFNSKYNANMMKIPVVSGGVDRTAEQLHYVVASLGKTIEDRQRFNKEISGFVKKIEKTRDGKSTDDLKSTLETKLADQKCQTQALQDEIASQGKTISIFTVLNVIFLPLSFFTQYFSSGKERDGAINASLDRFWAVTGSITGVIVLIAFIYYSKSNYNWRQYVRFWRDLVPSADNRRRSHKLIKKPDVQEQKLYLKRLPKYRINAKAIDTPKAMYLMKPDFSRDDLTLKLTDSLHDAGTFCFDEETGWLLHPEVDRYNYIYRAHVKSVFPHNTMTMKVCWKRSAMVTELAPYRFMGRFQVRKRREMGQVREIGLEWEFSGRDDPEGHSEKRRWDTKQTRLAGNFMVHGIEGGTSSGRSWWDILFRRDRRRTAGGSSGQQRLRHELSVVNPWTVEGGTRRDEDGQTAPDEVLTEVERVPANEPGAATSQNNTRYKLLMVPVHPGTEIE